jgi:hypothetical protein
MSVSWSGGFSCRCGGAARYGERAQNHSDENQKPPHKAPLSDRTFSASRPRGRSAADRTAPRPGLHRVFPTSVGVRPCAPPARRASAQARLAHGRRHDRRRRLERPDLTSIAASTPSRPSRSKETSMTSAGMPSSAGGRQWPGARKTPWRPVFESPAYEPEHLSVRVVTVPSPSSTYIAPTPGCAASSWPPHTAQAFEAAASTISMDRCIQCRPRRVPSACDARAIWIAE